MLVINMGTWVEKLIIGKFFGSTCKSCWGRKYSLKIFTVMYVHEELDIEIEVFLFS